MYTEIIGCILFSSILDHNFPIFLILTSCYFQLVTITNNILINIFVNKILTIHHITFFSQIGKNKCINPKCSIKHSI